MAVRVPTAAGSRLRLYINGHKVKYGLHLLVHLGKPRPQMAKTGAHVSGFL